VSGRPARTSHHDEMAVADGLRHLLGEGVTVLLLPQAKLCP
jgi:hypothetical protein